MAEWESERVIRDTEVKVFADSFNTVCGLYGPEEVWAETFDGQPFGLTTAEEEKIAVESANSRLFRALYPD